jgi:molecular chaperone HtpG
VKKVADKINSLFNTEREEFEKLWRDIKTFVEYGALRDKKFYDRVLPSIIWEKTSGGYVTLDDYLENAKEKHENTVYYANDKVVQAQYISMFEKENIDVVVLDTVIETQFITLIENEKKIKFMRIDADVASALKGEGEAGDEPELTEIFKEVSANEKLTVKYELLKDTSTPAVLTISEEARRMSDMMRMYRMNADDITGMPEVESTLIINKANTTVKHLIEAVGADKARARNIASQMYNLALLAQRPLTADELRAFLAQSYGMLEKI